MEYSVLVSWKCCLEAYVSSPFFPCGINAQLLPQTNIYPSSTRVNKPPAGKKRKGAFFFLSFFSFFFLRFPRTDNGQQTHTMFPLKSASNVLTPDESAPSYDELFADHPVNQHRPSGSSSAVRYLFTSPLGSKTPFPLLASPFPHG